MEQHHQFILNTIDDTHFLAQRLHEMLMPHVKNQFIKIGLIGGSGIGKSTLAKAIISEKPIRYEDMIEHGHNNQMSLITDDLKHVRLYDVGTKKSPYNTFLNVARDENFRKTHTSGLDIVEHADLENNIDDYCVLIHLQSAKNNQRICAIEITKTGYKKLSKETVDNFLNKTMRGKVNAPVQSLSLC